MRYEKIEEKTSYEVTQVLFSGSDIADKKTALFAAIYYLPVEQVISILMKIFDGKDVRLKLEAIRVLEPFMQSRQTNQGYSKFCNYIATFNLANPECKDEIDGISEALKELNEIMGGAK